MHRRLARLAPWVVILTALVWANASRADVAETPEPHPIWIRTAPCAAASSAIETFVATLNVELAGHGQGRCEWAAPEQILPETAVVIELTLESCNWVLPRVIVSVSRGSAQRAQRSISLSDVAVSARPRALALLVAEWVRHVDRDDLGEPADPPSPAAATPPAAIPAPVELAVSDSKPRRLHPPVRWNAEAAGELRYAPHLHSPLWATHLGITRVQQRLRIEAEVAGVWAQRHVEQGQLNLSSAFIGLLVGPRFVTGPVAFDVSAHSELGWVHVKGERASTQVIPQGGSGPAMNLGLRLSMEAPEHWRLRPRLSIEGGGTPLAFTANVNGHSALGFSGGYALLAIAAAVGTD